MKKRAFAVLLGVLFTLVSCDGGVSSAASSSSSVSAASSSAVSSAASSSAVSSAASSSAVSSAASSSSSSSESSSAVSSVEATYKVASLTNLSPDFFTVKEDVKAGTEYKEGDTVTLTLVAGANLSQGFLASSSHLDHIYVDVNGSIYKPSFPEGTVSADSVLVSFKAPASDAKIVVCYSVQQHVKADGKSIAFEADDYVKAYGVKADEKYDYIDCYIVTDPDYVMTSAEFKYNADTTSAWNTISINGKTGVGSLTSVSGMDGVYTLEIRPNSADLTDDVTVRFEGEKHSRHTITYTNATEDYLIMADSTLPTSGLEGSYVKVALSVKSGAYCKAITYTGLTAAGVNYSTGSAISFTMPDADVVFTFEFAAAMDISCTLSSHVKSVKVYKDDIYSEPVTKAVPGDNLYVVPTMEDGYLFKGAGFSADALVAPTYDWSGAVYSVVTVPEDATSISLVMDDGVAFKATKAAPSNGTFDLDRATGTYGEGETVTLTAYPNADYEVDKVSVLKADGTDGGVTVTAGQFGTYTFPMPAFDVTVSVSFKKSESTGEKFHVSAVYDSDEFKVSSSTDYSWDFTAGFDVNSGTSVYLDVLDNYGNNFHVSIVMGTEIVVDVDATVDEESGEYSFGKSIVITGETLIIVTAK